jgi:hypothetical protein
VRDPVLITTAIKPPSDLPFLKMTDDRERLIATKCAIFYWVAQGAKKIVVVDGTNTPALDERDIALIESSGTAIESLAFAQDDSEIRQYGKAFGEGRILRFALEQSQILKQHDFFYKCTGKCFCRNFPEIAGIIERNNINSIFWRLFDRNFYGDDLTLADTRFFYTSTEIARQMLLPAYEESKNVSIERVLAVILGKTFARTYIQKSLITGFAGGVGGQYDEFNLGYLDQQFPAWVLGGAQQEPSP